MPNIFSILNKCPPSSTITFCNTLFYAGIFVVGYFVFAVIIGIVSELFKVPKTSISRLRNWMKTPKPSNIKVEWKVNKFGEVLLKISNKEWRCPTVEIQPIVQILTKPNIGTDEKGWFNEKEDIEMVKFKIFQCYGDSKI